MEGLSYKIDNRHKEPDSDELRKRNFKIGWDDACERKKTYKAETLEELTWQNLGYRIGKILGNTSDELKEKMYRLCVEQQKERISLQS